MNRKNPVRQDSQSIEHLKIKEFHQAQKWIKGMLLDSEFLTTQDKQFLKHIERDMTK